MEQLNESGNKTVLVLGACFDFYFHDAPVSVCYFLFALLFLCSREKKRGEGWSRLVSAVTFQQKVDTVSLTSSTLRRLLAGNCCN